MVELPKILLFLSAFIFICTPLFELFFAPPQSPLGVLEKHPVYSPFPEYHTRFSSATLPVMSGSALTSRGEYLLAKLVAQLQKDPFTLKMTANIRVRPVDLITTTRAYSLAHLSLMTFMEYQRLFSLLRYVSCLSSSFDNW